MAVLNDKIRIYLSENGKVYKDEKSNYILENDGSGDKLISWNVSGLAEPSISQLDALTSKADTDASNRIIGWRRKKSYGDIGDQLDMLYKDLVAGKLDATGEWAKAVKKVKDDNPKS